MRTNYLRITVITFCAFLLGCSSPIETAIETTEIADLLLSINDGFARLEGNEGCPQHYSASGASIDVIGYSLAEVDKPLTDSPDTAIPPNNIYGKVSVFTTDLEVMDSSAILAIFIPHLFVDLFIEYSIVDTEAYILCEDVEVTVVFELTPLPNGWKQVESVSDISLIIGSETFDAADFLIAGIGDICLGVFSSQFISDFESALASSITEIIPLLPSFNPR